MDLENTMMLILSELKDLKQGQEEMRKDIRDLKYGHEELKQNMATLINAQTTMSNEITELTKNMETIARVSEVNSLDIVKLRAENRKII